MATATSDRPEFGFTTMEIVFMALVGVVFGTIFSFTAPLNHFFATTFGVWGELIISWYMIPQALAALVIRKPGAYFITTGINMLTQGLAGNPAGFLAITGWWLFGGTAAEVTLWLFRYSKWRFYHLAVVVAMNLLFNWPVSFWFFGWGAQGAVANIVSTFLQMFTFGIEGAGGAWILARILHGAGLLGGYKYAKDMREAQLAQQQA
jgi:ABC-type thiamin/hydroxymethylpyrimidine transport system permease subunit